MKLTRFEVIRLITAMGKEAVDERDEAKAEFVRICTRKAFIDGYIDNCEMDSMIGWVNAWMDITKRRYGK